MVQLKPYLNRDSSHENYHSPKKAIIPTSVNYQESCSILNRLK